MDKFCPAIPVWPTVEFMTTSYTQNQLASLQLRIRQLREARHLTLLDVERVSEGQVSAIALGSYERGDRQMSVAKLISIATLYQLPVTELFAEKPRYFQTGRITIDIRKLHKSQDPEAQQLISILAEIAKRRGDWNGEIMSLRNNDMDNLSIFSGFATAQIESIVAKFGFARSKYCL